MSVTDSRTLAGWLEYIERQHPKTIELGLERVARVRDTLAIPKFCPIIIVGGTNGKGSTCAMLESILGAAGYRVGLYTSPHLIDYGERVRIQGVQASEAALVRGFERVEAARGDQALTYFEFGTLCAWAVFADAKADVLVLEVGLGGRLDAVNAFEPDCSILTSVALDHQDYLGDTRERIGWEKAHIFRPGRPAICADPEVPATVFEHARAIGADLQVLGRDFGFSGDRQQWSFWGRDGKRPALAYPALRGANQLLNASAALAALDSLRETVPVTANAVRTGLALVELPGRFQVLPGRPTIILDVAHNPHAAAVLAANLDSIAADAKSGSDTIAVFGMLHDKDVAGVCAALKGRIDRWHVAGLPGPRGSTAELLREAIRTTDVIADIATFSSITAAFAAAREQATVDDRIVAFGSFLTVADILSAWRA